MQQINSLCFQPKFNFLANFQIDIQTNRQTYLTFKCATSHTSTQPHTQNIYTNTNCQLAKIANNLSNVFPLFILPIPTIFLPLDNHYINLTPPSPFSRMFITIILPIPLFKALFCIYSTPPISFSLYSLHFHFKLLALI